MSVRTTGPTTPVAGLTQPFPATLVDAKGDLLAGTANDAISRLAVGSNRQIITADSSVSTGLRWYTPTIIDIDHPSFGVIGNGITDDRSAIQAVIDATATALPGGAIIQFGGKRYRISAPGLVRTGSAQIIYRGVTPSAFNESDSQSSGTTLFGDPGVTIFTQGATPAGVNHRGPVFENITFRESGGGKTSELVRINNTNRWTFRNCGFRGGAAGITPYADSGTGPGAGGADASWGFIENCWMSNCTVGLNNIHGVDITVVGGDWECTTSILNYPASSLTGAITVLGAWFDSGVGIDTKGFGGSFIGCDFENCNPAINIIHDVALHASSGFNNKILGAHINGTGVGDVGVNIGTGATGTQLFGVDFGNVATKIVDAGGTTTIFEGGNNPVVYDRPTSTSAGYLLFKNAGTNLVRMMTDGATSWRMDQLVPTGKIRFRLGGTSSSDEFAVQDSAGANVLRVFGNGQINVADPGNIALGTATGTKFGTAANQKQAWWGATPVVQPAANPDTSGATLGQLETEMNEIKQLLRTVGLMAP